LIQTKRTVPWQQIFWRHWISIGPTPATITYLYVPGYMYKHKGLIQYRSNGYSKRKWK